MRTIYFLMGLPASGKSTYAKQLAQDSNNIQRINKDDFRSMLSVKFSKDNEKHMNNMRLDSIRRSLLTGYDVVIDDTNFEPKNFDDIVNIAMEIGDVEIKKIYFDVDFDVCVSRNETRIGNAKVPIEVIENMATKYVYNDKYADYLKSETIVIPKKEQYVMDEDLPKCILVDIDGTLAHMKDRSPFDWKSVGNDEVDYSIKKLLTYISAFDFIEIIFISGRDRICRAETVKWLDSNVDIEYSKLLMRKNNDYRDDTIVKEELYNEYIKNKYNVLFVLDDRTKVVRMWRSLGLKCLQVEDNNF